MAPVAYIEQVRRMFPNDPPYQWTVNTKSPWVPMTKSVRDCRIALISSGGIYHRTQAPFDSVKNDLTFREIPKEVDMAELQVSHYSPKAKKVQDLNTIFPLQRL
ncbi:MAG: D-proline reductase (dithiol), partial [candidate division NC10 bacterium]|nr:D-proline reductase (dithiol) [candidate division NC10 bacterium]